MYVTRPSRSVENVSNDAADASVATLPERAPAKSTVLLAAPSRMGASSASVPRSEARGVRRGARKPGYRDIVGVDSTGDCTALSRNCDSSLAPAH
jgi:hypothetical protein